MPRIREKPTTTGPILPMMSTIFFSPSSAVPTEPEPKPAPTLEQVRAVLAEKSRAGHTAAIRELLQKYGVAKLSLVDPQHYEALLKDAEGLADAT